MKETLLDWNDFIDKYKSQQIRPWVDLSKAPQFMSSKHAPSNWRITINLIFWVSILGIPVSLILFFFIKWWIPLIIISLIFMFRKAVKDESAKAIIEESIKNPEFYSHAIQSGTMKTYLN